MKNNRRDFLKHSLLLGATSQLSTTALFTGILNGLIDKAHGSILDSELINYISLWQWGGVERWYFDGVPCPKGYENGSINIGHRYTKIKNMEDIEGKNIIMGKNGEDSLGLEYATTKINNIHLPHLWNSMLPGVNGDIAMKELAQYMISIRGIHTDVGFDAHGANVSMAENPMKRIPTVSALPAVNANYYFPFAHAASGSPSLGSERLGVSIDPSNVTQTISRFQIPKNGSLNARVTFKNNNTRKLMEETIVKIAKNLPPSKQKFAKVLLESRKSAIQMMDFVNDEMQNIENFYNESFLIYSNLFQALTRNHLDRPLEGLDDRAIHNPKRVSQGKIDEAYLEKLKKGFHSAKDQEFLNGNWNEDLRNYFLDYDFTSLAKRFATIETYLKFNITNSIKLTCNQHSGTFNSPGDEHDSGNIHKLFIHSKHYQVLATGILNCINRLGSMNDTLGANIGNKTLFHLRSDFDRKPEERGYGSNHNILNCTESFFSKMISNGPHIIGNIQTNGKVHLPGVGMNFNNGNVLTYKNIWSTVAVAAGLEADRNFVSLIKRNGLSLVPATDECKNIG